MFDDRHVLFDVWNEKCVKMYNAVALKPNTHVDWVSVTVLC